MVSVSGANIVFKILQVVFGEKMLTRTPTLGLGLIERPVDWPALAPHRTERLEPLIPHKKPDYSQQSTVYLVLKGGEDLRRRPLSPDLSNPTMLHKKNV